MPKSANAVKAKLEKYIFYFKDIAWSIAAVFLMNAVMQFILFPILRNVLGEDEYGNVLYLLGIVNIISIPIGSGASMARIKASMERSDNSVDYYKILAGTFIIMLPFSVTIMFISDMGLNIGYILLYWALICATIYSHYAAVEYRLNTNYKGYFIYHLTISAGYLAGIAAFHLTHIWILMLLPGELAGGILSLYQTREKRKVDQNKTSNLRETLKPIMVLASSQLLVNLVFNADRIILKVFVNSAAVTIFYVSSLVGKSAAMVTDPLNNVLIGYLAKKEGNLSRRFFIRIAGIIFICSLCITGISILGSHLFVFLFYPREYETAKEFFAVANFAMIMYFVTGIITTILLRFLQGKYQLYINIFYVSIFLLIVIPSAFYGGMRLFAVSLCIVNVLRFLFAVIIGIVKLREKGVTVIDETSKKES